MNRANFLKSLPLGILGMAVLAQGKKDENPQLVKAKHITLNTPEGQYNVLAVKSDTEMETVDAAVITANDFVVR